MARTKAFKKNEVVIYNSEIHTVNSDQHLYRGKQCVKITCDHGVHTFRVLASELRRVPEAESVDLSSQNLMGKTIKVNIPTPVWLQEQPVEQVSTNKYQRTICEAGTTNSLTVDVYDVLEAFKVTCPALQHLAKKALCVGIRGHKDTEQDLKDIIASAQRALQLHCNRMGI